MKKKISLPIPERGQSLVELALSLTVILMLLTGAVEFGLALFHYVTIRDAAQEAALYGSIHPTDEAEMRARAIAAASDVLPLTDADITISDNNGKRCEGIPSGGGDPNAITVSIIFYHPITMPFVSAMIGSNTITLNASVTDTILTPSQDPSTGDCPP